MSPRAPVVPSIPKDTGLPPLDFFPQILIAALVARALAAPKEAA